MKLGVARNAILGLLMLSVGGCSWLFGDSGYFRDREGDYREARTEPPPSVPEDLSDAALGESMHIPPATGMDRYRAQSEYEVPRPSTLFARETDRSVRIQRFDRDAWIVAPDTPPQVWPRVLQFLADNGVRVAREEPEDGILITEWLELTDSGYRDVVRSVLAEQGGDEPYHRLRLQVSQAVRHGATEVSLDHYAGDTTYERVDWPEHSVSERAAESLLNELAGYLAAQVGQGGVSLLAQNIATEPKAEVMLAPDSEPMLRLRLDQRRAWATIGSALNNAEIEVLESSSSDGRYRIRYDESQFQGDEPGWFARTFAFLTGGPRVDELVLQLTPAPDGYNLEVFLEDGEQRPSSEYAEEVLTVLREFAS